MTQAMPASRIRWISLLCTFTVPSAAAEPAPPAAVPLVAGGRPAAAIVADPNGPPTLRVALAKLQEAIRRDSGQPTPLPVAGTPADAPSGRVVIGTANGNPELARLAAGHQLPLDTLAAQGFLLRTLTDEGRPMLVIAGADARGVLYGVREAIDQVITSTPHGDVYAAACDVTLRPALEVRGTYCLTCWGGCPSYDRTAWEEAIDAMADAGMNRVMFWMDGLFRSQRHPDAFLSRPGQHFARTRLTSDDIHRLIRFAHDRGMDFYFGSGVFGWFTAGEYIAKRFKDAADPSGSLLCPSSPAARRVTREYLSEMIEVFPEADGYMLEIRDEMHDCKCSTCQKKLDDRGSRQFGQSEMDFLEELTATVWEGHPRTKFIWLMGYGVHDEDVMYYERLRQIGRDPRLEWLEVRSSWTLPSADGGRRPLRDFSDRIYHWDQYYRLSAEHMQSAVRRTTNEGLHGYLPAYEPGFANLSVYPTDSETPFPVRLIPFCVTQFYYRAFTWHPKITKPELLARAHRQFFSAEVPPQLADDLMFLKQFMAAHHVELTRSIGAGLDAGPGLIDAVENSFRVDRRGGDKTRKWLLEAVGADIRRLQTLLAGRGDMVRLAQIEQRVAGHRPKASPRSRASLDILQRAIDDIRRELAKCGDYAKDADEALRRVDRYIDEIVRRSPSTTQPGSEDG